ncbi:hypothetical protein [Pseudomonas caricapapayae]|uniref:hypothetical protein n=1 Tax=Pseudomonas caricapapayae TaxID=46678 RepID=UPI0011C36B7E|nr:hypothetical protein [Pseudomonas caricapapayae]
MSTLMRSFLKIPVIKKINLEKVEAKPVNNNEKKKENDSWIDDLLDSDSFGDGGGGDGGD